MLLPLKAKIAIRDTWNQNDSPIQAARSRVQTLLGLPVTCEPDWALLLAELSKTYPEPTHLVSVASAICEVWFEAMGNLLDEAALEDWIETLLNNSPGELRVFLDICEGGSPSTQWKETVRGFVVYLPKDPIRDARDFISDLTEQISTAFEVSADECEAAGFDHLHNTWTEVDGTSTDETSREARPTGPSTPLELRNKTIDYLPKPDIMPRPDELLSQPPYFLHVIASSTTCVEVHCSHSPTLESLNAYLKKWCRTDSHTTNREPLLAIKLHHACFGLGVTYDRLTLSVERRRGEPITVSPTIVLSLVEGHFGYEKTYSDSSNWHFRRERAFKG